MALLFKDTHHNDLRCIQSVHHHSHTAYASTSSRQCPHLQPCEAVELQQVHVSQHSSVACLATMQQQAVATDGSSTGAAGAGHGTATKGLRQCNTPHERTLLWRLSLHCHLLAAQELRGQGTGTPDKACGSGTHSLSAHCCGSVGGSSTGAAGGGHGTTTEGLRKVEHTDLNIQRFSKLRWQQQKSCGGRARDRHKRPATVQHTT
jgi:hypothetical protein